jgi:hypothetical protein
MSIMVDQNAVIAELQKCLKVELEFETATAFI